jgi:hypothetical protein
MSKRTFSRNPFLLGLFVLPLLGGCGEEDDPGSTAEDTSTTTSTADTTDTSGTDTTGNNDTTESGESGDTTTDGNTFVPDGEGMSCGAECDIWNPDDCPEGEKCTSVACEVGSGSWDSNVCREIQGSAAEGDECMFVNGSGIDGNDTCDKGSMCWGGDPDTGLGVCVAFCIGSIDAYSCASADKICDISNNGTLPLCLPACDPLAPDCPGEEVCIPLTDGTGFSCNPSSGGGMAPNGTPCNYINDCNAGLVCADAVVNPACDSSASGCCTEVCALDATENTCAGAAEGQVCEAFYEMPPPGYENVGLCAIPQPNEEEPGLGDKIKLHKAIRTQRSL